MGTMADGDRRVAAVAGGSVSASGPSRTARATVIASGRPYRSGARFSGRAKLQHERFAATVEGAAGPAGAPTILAVRHPEFEDLRLVAVYDAENVWGWDDDLFMSLLAERSAPRVLDFGCGTGRLAIAMAAASHEVTAVDPAGASLAAARSKPGAERVRWLQGSTEVLPAAAFDAALLTGHVAQLFVDDAEWAALLRSLRRSLDRRGRLIFDSRNPADRRWDRWNPVDSRRTIMLPDGGSVDAWTEVISVAGGAVSFVHHYVFADGDEVSSAATLRFRTERELRASLEAAGFDVDRIYGGWAREPVGLSEDGELVVVAVVRPPATA
jgi:SAM-dependent methyltransferase